ncbi:hypothetical protein V8C35DRAFT_293249 [Trichoderma chlorosporum]
MSWRRNLLIRQGPGVGGSAISPICFGPCNNAFVIVQKDGKTPALCDDPNYRDLVNVCSKCLTANPPAQNTTGLVSSDPYFQLIFYCEFAVHTVTGSFTQTNGQLTTVIYIVPESLAATSTTGSTTTSRDTKTSQSPPSTSAKASTDKPATPTSSNSHGATSSSPVPVDTSAPAPSSHAWIAGPILGSIIGLAVICGILFYLWRRHGQANRATHNATNYDAPYDKAQLHSDCIPKPEPQPVAIHELDSNAMCPRAEMSVNEAPAVELPVRNETEAFESSITRDLDQVLTNPDGLNNATRSNNVAPHGYES